MSNFESALALKPQDPLSLVLMLDMYSDSQQSWEVADRVFGQLYASTSDLNEKSYYAAQRAAHLWKFGSDKLRAVEVLEDFLRVQPHHHKVLLQISEYYQQLGMGSDAGDSLWRRAEKLQGEEACNAYSQLGRYYMKLKSSCDEAIRCFERGLSLNPCHKESFECLEQILCERGDFERLSVHYESRLLATASARDKAVLLKRLAVLYEMQLSQPLRSISLLRQYREVFPDDLDAIQSLQRLCRRTSRWAELIEMLHVEKHFLYRV